MTKITTSETTARAIITAWQTYTMNIGAVTTAPTKGTIAQDNAQWRRVGQNMEIRYNYRQTAAGASGSGIYLFPIPAGYSIDTSITGQTIAPNYNAEAAVGCGSCFNGTNTYPIISHVYDADYLTLTYDSSSSVISDSAMGLGSAADLTISCTASVPIVGWS